MKTPSTRILDANEAVATIAYQLSEVIAIYPITPASPMGEWADVWSAAAQPNLWNSVPSVVEMQSEGGAAGLLHGALQTGALATSFTASQGLLLMIPTMYKIAGELTPAVLHVAARSIAAQALSIFGDHSDVMAARATGWVMLNSTSVQEAQDFALIAHSATLETRLPFLHFFDGFRTSHELATITTLEKETLLALVDENLVAAHRARGLTPDHPVLRGTAQNPDVYFQARESVNPRYAAAPDLVQRTMDRFAELTGRSYHLFDYHGAPDADRVAVLMGSGAEAAHEVVDHLNAQGQRTGVLKVRLFRPFDVARFSVALPTSVRALAVLDRTKEPGSCAEPLHLDCLAALSEQGRADIRVVGGRYGLASKEFTPAMLVAVFDNLAAPTPKNHFTVGIDDDVSHTSLPVESGLDFEPKGTYRAVFFGLGSDGTVGANKESVKIIGQHTGRFAQGYFVYDSRKAGAVTVSHLRFADQPIRSSYLIEQASFVACHQWQFLENQPVLDRLAPGGTFLLNSPYPPESVWSHLPAPVREALVAKRAHFHVIDAHRVARENHLAGRINTVMQTCFFAIADILPRDKAMEAIRHSIGKTYQRKGREVVEKNLAAVDRALEHLHEVPVPAEPGDGPPARPPVPGMAPDFVRRVLGPMMAGCGDRLPVSALPEDGTFPTGTTQWEKRNLAEEVPVWDADVCIQCGKCVMVCPHGVIRSKAYEPCALEGAPESFQTRPARLPAWSGLNYTLQVSVEDCTGCGICVDVCPAKNKSTPRFKAINMEPQPPLRESEARNWQFFLSLPETDRNLACTATVRAQQVQQPLFEFSSACPGCGETPYLKLISQLFGDRMLVANATGCSSIYGGNLPTTPWASNAAGRGPAWSNSLFENNAEFGLGYRVSIDQQRDSASRLLSAFAPQIGDELCAGILTADQRTEPGIFEQRERIDELLARVATLNTPEARRFEAVASHLVRRSVWIVGGDGWANDIGFGGLDHVLASGRDVNILVLDTEVYSNTGGQMSKATPRAATAKFASAGKQTPKKDLGLLAIATGGAYVASVAMGAKDEHTLKVFLEAEAFDGPSLIIAYSHCIAHGIAMGTAMQNQKAAVDCGQWLLYRHDPSEAAEGRTSFHLDSPEPRIPVEQYLRRETRFAGPGGRDPEVEAKLFALVQEDARRRRRIYVQLGNSDATAPGEPPLTSTT